MNSIGQSFRVTTFGESHGAAVGAVIDGCPSMLELSEADLQPQLDRRRPGQSDLTTSRQEADQVSILSGVENGKTLGSPIALMVRNRDMRPGDYGELSRIPRPSHADYSYQARYGIKAASGGGRSSARETIGRVASGAVADKLLRLRYGVEIVAWVSAVGDVCSESPDPAGVRRADVDTSAVRCPDPDAARRMEALVREAAEAGDSRGGVISCVCRGVPAGWGEPVFDKVEALLARAMLSIPATKGFEIGSGFAGTRLRGSEHNDPFMAGPDGGIIPRTNNAGGVLGGITSGAPLLFRVAFKPVATIRRPQQTVDYEGKPVELKVESGRHDPCVLPRAVPIVESMAALVLADVALRAARDV